MLKDLFTNRLFIGALAFFVLCVAGSLLYMHHETRKGAEYAAETQDRVAEWNAKQNQQPPVEAPVGDTSQGGHFHADGTRHAEPHAPTAAVSNRSSVTPLAFAAGVHPTSVSSNPLFADGVPEHLQCPKEFVGVYRREDEANFRQRVPRSIYDEIKEKWNPNRPIKDVWPAFIEQEKWYRANADPERAELFGAAGRLDWLVQGWLDYPEITVLLDEDAPRASDMLRVEIGLFDPDWNAFTLPDGSGRTFRTADDKKYVFTWSAGPPRTLEDGSTISYEGPWTLTDGPSNGDPNAEVIEIDLDTITDAELEELGGWNFNINPYTTGLYKLGDN